MIIIILYECNKTVIMPSKRIFDPKLHNFVTKSLILTILTVKLCVLQKKKTIKGRQYDKLKLYQLWTITNGGATCSGSAPDAFNSFTTRCFRISFCTHSCAEVAAVESRPIYTNVMVASLGLHLVGWHIGNSGQQDCWGQQLIKPNEQNLLNNPTAHCSMTTLSNTSQSLHLWCTQLYIGYHVWHASLNKI